MRTRSSSNLPVESPPNPSTSNPKCCNRRRSKQPFILEESLVDIMVDQRTMAELLRAPTEGCAEAIVVPSILAEQFELKHSLINMMTSDQFFEPEKGNPHDHICWFNKITYTIKYKDVPNSAIKLMLFSFNLAEAARLWLEKEPSHSIFTWEDLVSKFINEFFPPQEQQISVMKFQTFNNGSGSLLSNTIANPKGDLKAITTQSGIVLDGPSIPIPPPFINPKEDERVEETLMDQDLVEYTIKKNVGLPKRISTRVTLELANRAICTLGGIARDVFVPVGKFTFSADFVIVDYESDPRVPLILGRPFLWTARDLIDVHKEEMILYDDDERLTLNMRHDTSSYSNQPQKESINLINVFNDSSEDFLEYLFLTNQPSGNPTFSSHSELTSPEVEDDIFDPEGCNVLPEKFLDLNSTKDLHPPHHVNPLSGSTTSSSSPNQLLEEFADELALITFSLEYDDDLQFDIESDLKGIEYLLHHDSILVDLVDQIESDTENVYDDPFDSKGEKIKEPKLLIYELDLPSDVRPSSEYDSFLSKDFSKVDALPSTKNKDNVI
nr:reverse transcriptase domain-containing protein [Tanacetum cinerariifolium]